MRRIAVTGIGVIAATGVGRERVWQALHAGDDPAPAAEPVLAGKKVKCKCGQVLAVPAAPQEPAPDDDLFDLAPEVARLLDEKGLSAHLSISDEREYAIAFVILEQNQR